MNSVDLVEEKLIGSGQTRRSSTLAVYNMFEQLSFRPGPHLNQVRVLSCRNARQQTSEPTNALQVARESENNQ